MRSKHGIRPTCIAETHLQLLLPPAPIQEEQKASTPTKTEQVQQASIPMQIKYKGMDMNSLDELCTICDEHSLDIEVQHFLSIYPRMNISKTYQSEQTM